uniref:Uncharacterized protein n=1 Tax=Phytophthora ramorum TaxID=164328 RepID=H3GCU9_PHYRM
MSKKTSACSQAGNDSTANAAKGVAAGAAAGAGLWGLAMPVVNMIGFSASGIVSGSAAASMMSTAAAASGGGVVSGSAVAVMQSIGAVGLATPIGLGLVAGGAAIGGAALLVKSKLSAFTDTDVDDDDDDDAQAESEKGLWVLVELTPASGKTKVRTFDDDYKARNAFLNSSATSKALFDPERKMVLELGWKESGKDTD